MRAYLITAVVAVVVIALVFRVQAVRNIVVGA